MATKRKLSTKQILKKAESIEKKAKKKAERENAVKKLEAAKKKYSK